MSYRKLSVEELEELREEFVQFLVANGVDADLWKRYQEQDLDKVAAYIEQFSKVVFEKSLEKVEYLEHRTSSHLKLFHFGEEKIELIALTSTSIDLNKLENFSQADFNEVELYTATKPYHKQREIELYEMTTKGCVVTDHTLFRLLKQMV